MSSDGQRQPEHPRPAVERLLTRDLDDRDGIGRPLSERARHAQRSVEAYLRAGDRPRWMERVMEIDRRLARERETLARAHRALADECGRDAAMFARRWEAVARAHPVDEELNDLIHQHNDWYPIERDLPMNPRTGDYVLINGRSYRRQPVSPEWVLEQFPASPPARP